MKKLAILAAVVCMLLMSCAAFASYPMRVRDDRGKLVTIKSKPMRIVSIAPSNTEVLYALGLGDRIVGVTKYCDYPAAARRKPKVGDMTISAEMVVALKPDLVVAHAYINNTVIRRLEKLGLTVFAIDPKNLRQITRDIRAIGKITARPKTAESVAKKMESTIASVKAKRAGKKPVKVLVAIQASPLWVAGPNTFVDEMIKISSAKNVSSDARPGYVTFSKELAVSRNPDVIFVGVSSDRRYFLHNPVWKHTNAVKHGRVYVMDNDLIVRPTPRLVIGLKELAGKL